MPDHPNTSNNEDKNADPNRSHDQDLSENTSKHEALGKTSVDKDSQNAGKKGAEDEDASPTEVVIYAFGNVEGAVADKVPEMLQSILIVAAHVNPLLLGFIMGIKTLWDGITDPLMAYITDNTQTRYGRRLPFILVGGVSRVLFLALFVFFLPSGMHLTTNKIMEAQKAANDSVGAAAKLHETVVKTYEQLPNAAPHIRAKMLNMIDGKLELSVYAKLMSSITFWKEKEPQDIPSKAQSILDVIRSEFPTLVKDADDRKLIREQKMAELSALESAGVPADDKRMKIAVGRLQTAEDKFNKAAELLEKTKKAEAQAIATLHGARYILSSYGVGAEELSANYPTAEAVEAMAKQQMVEAGLDPIDVFSLAPVPAPKPKELKPPFSGIKEGFAAFVDPKNYDQRGLVIYVLIGMLIFTTLTTVNSVPYYALGIELSPSYSGRTQVVVYRSIMNKVAGLALPWVPVFCFSLMFTTAYTGLFWVTVCVCIIGIPSTVLMFFKTKERTKAKVKKAGERPSLIKSMIQIAREPEFVRMLFLWVFIGLVNGLFTQIGFFLNVYWVMGSALSGATLGAQVSMLAWAIGFVQLPLIKWACDRFQKHRVLQFSLIWMSIGTALKWWLMDPEHPEYQFILPFFFSVGIGSVYTVLPAMLADITDLDERKYGLRREGMFGAVMAFLTKAIGAIVPIGAGAILVLSGFDASLEYHQEPKTITNMRLMFSFVPAFLLLFALFVLIKYPLTKERVAEIKAELKARRESEQD